MVRVSRGNAVGVRPLNSVVRFHLGTVDALKIAIGSLLWIVAATIPIWIHNLYWNYRASIGCPATGDCYAPGWWYAEELTLVMVASAATIWPMALWHLVKWINWLRKGRK